MSLACAAHKEINVLHSGDIQVFIKAVHSVLKDDGFQLPTPMAANALEAANNILEWSSRACCLAELTDDDGVTDECQDWVNQLDRGGLNHVSSNMYMLIATMELQLQSLLKQTINQPNSNTMEKATPILMSNDDVLFHWSVTSAAWEADLEQALFPMIVDLWVTMRGFSFVSAWVEQYKTHCKRTV